MPLSDVTNAAETYANSRVADARAELQPVIDAAAARASAAERALADHMASAHPVVPPPPEPATTKNAPLLGMSAPNETWGTRKREVEATGGKLQARRIFLNSLTAGLGLIDDAHRENLLPVVSFKVGNDWAGVGTGKYDTQLKTLATTLAAKKKRIIVCLHHEPDQQSTPADVGEGGTATQFAQMYRRATPILKTATNVEVWPIQNGWWWTSEKRALTDAQIDAWLPADVRRLVDGIAADDYSPQDGEAAVVKTRNRAAWAHRVGDVKALGIGETNAFTPQQLTDVFNYAKTEPLFQGGFACVWNSTGGTYQPLTETGLLDDFQTILKGWPAS